MKIVIFGVPNQVDDNEVLQAITEVVKTLGVNVKCTVLTRDDILPPSNENIFIKKKDETKYVRAVKMIMKTFGDIVRRPDDRASFYDGVLKKKVERPILEVLAFGPMCNTDLNALKDAGGQEFVSICRTALSLLNTL